MARSESTCVGAALIDLLRGAFLRAGFFFEAFLAAGLFRAVRFLLAPAFRVERFFFAPALRRAVFLLAPACFRAGAFFLRVGAFFFRA
jgi:hypothetical protein